MNKQRWISIIPWVTAAFALLVYLPVLQLGYVWDDWQLFINNPALRLPELVWQGLLQPILPGTTYFRPLTLGSFALEFSAYGVEPMLSHALNLALHVGNTLLVGLIAAHLTTDSNSSMRAWRILTAGLIYGLHPALIEPITWISGRFDLMATFFILLGIWAYLTLNRWHRDFFVVVFFLLAAFSKEVAATMPVLLFLLYIGQQGQNTAWRLLPQNLFRSGEWKLYALLLVAGTTIIVIRKLIFGQFAHADLSVKAALEGPTHHLALIGQTLIFYAKMSVWPISDLNPQHPFNPAEMTSLMRWVGAIAAFTGTVALAILIKNRRWPGLMLAGWAIALLPVLNIIPLTIGGNIGHERFLTLPLVFIALGISLVRLPKMSSTMSRALPAGVGLLGILILSISIANIRLTIPLWANELTLWSWAYARHPDFPFVQASYIGAAIHYGDFSRAETALEKARNKLNFQFKATKGIYLAKNNRPDEAITQFEDALKGAEPPHEQLLRMGFKLEDVETLRMNGAYWFYRSTYTGLAGAYLDLGKYEQALNSAQIALFYAPYYPTAWMLKSLALYGLDQWDEGEKTFVRAQHYFIPIAGKQAQDIRVKFLKKLCDESLTSSKVCGKWREEIINLSSVKFSEIVGMTAPN